MGSLHHNVCQDGMLRELYIFQFSYIEYFLRYVQFPWNRSFWDFSVSSRKNDCCVMCDPLDIKVILFAG